MRQKTVIATTLGECVHVAGVTNFLRLAEAAGWQTVFLGPVVLVDEVIAASKSEKAALDGVSQKAEKCSGKAGAWRSLWDSRELSTLVRRSLNSFTWVVLPSTIFLPRVVDVTLGTMRIIFISRGRRYLAPLLVFVEVLIWITVVADRWRCPQFRYLLGLRGRFCSW